jgi:acetyl-CoA decarbonylase/synthase complex subunit gamma
MGVRLAAVEVDSPADKAVTRVKTISEKSTVPLIIMSNNPEVMSAAVNAIADKKPLIYKADEANAEQFIKIAAETKCPLAINADTIEKLAGISNSAREKGVTDMVFSFDGKKTAHTIRHITTIRRAALKKNFRTMGFPVMVDISMDNSMKETALAATFAAKYAGIIILNGIDGSELLPILTTIQNIYTDPQVPNTVEAKLYEIGHVSQDSPVLFTTNFSLTYFCVEGEVERSKVPCYICVVDTEGLGILNAYAGDKLSVEKVVKTIASQNVSEKVKHRKLIIPGLLPSFRAELEDTSEWKEVLIGPENASGIPVFLTQNWKK